MAIDDEEEKPSKKESAAKKKDDEERISEEETEGNTEGGKTDGSNKNGGKKNDDDKKDWRKFFFDEENNPKPEGFLAVLLSGFAAYYLMTYKSPQKELVYMDFLNNFLLKNDVKEINITKDRRSEIFNYSA